MTQQADAMRASHGQAPTQAAPAAVAGPSDVVSIQRQAFIRGWDERGMAHQLKGTVETDERMRVLMDIYFPRTAAPTTQQAAQHDGEFWPVDENASRKQLIAQIGQMNFRLTALRQENAGLIKRVAGQAEALQNYQRSHETAPQQQSQEPVAWRLTNTAFRNPKYEYFTHKSHAEVRQEDFNRSVDDGGLHDLTPLYTVPSPASQEGNVNV